jgi:hypothetical protein
VWLLADAGFGRDRYTTCGRWLRRRSGRWLDRGTCWRRACIDRS